MNSAAKGQLLNYGREQLAGLLIAWGEKPSHANCLFRHMHQDGEVSFNDLPSIPHSLQQRLQALDANPPLTIVRHQVSVDGTQKWLLQLDDSQTIETVFIPEATRGTLCVSSQVGCALQCQFCATGDQGFKRNLSVAEIIGQVWMATRALAQDGKVHSRPISNVVMMGMGEPLHNFDHVVTAMDIMMDDFAYGLSKYRVTLSTSGLIPAMKKLFAVSDVSLAVSLHASNDEVRNTIVPINKKYSIEKLIAACHEYQRHVTIEYVMLDGINDDLSHAHELTELLHELDCKINLIPFNPYQGARYQCTPRQRILDFQKILVDAGFNTIVRKTRGQDIDAACGQLSNIR